MKKATKLAMIGSGIILLIEILYKIMYFLDFQINQQFYQIISFFQMIAPITIFNFFVILYKKQNNTSLDSNEQRNKRFIRNKSSRERKS